METFVNLGEVFFRGLAGCSFQVSVLVVMVLVLKAVLGRRLSARWHYCLWLLVVVRMVMPFGLASPVSIFNLFKPVSILSQSGIDEDDGKAVISSSVSEEYVSPGPVVIPMGTKPSVEIEKDRAMIEAGVERVEGRRVRVLPIGWFAGALILGVYILISNFRLWLSVRSEALVTEQWMVELLEECKRQMNVRTAVSIVLTEKVKSPVLFGFLRPRMLLPGDVINTLGRSKLRYVFLHELGHVRRYDILLGWLTCVLLILHWFNPLVWYAFYRMRTEGELACDELVLSTMSADEPQEYGETIVSLLEQFYHPRYVPGVAGILESKSQLKRRLIMITKFRKGSRKLSIVAVLVLILVASIGLTDARPRPERDYEGSSGHVAVSTGWPEAKLVPAGVRDNLVLYYTFSMSDGESSISAVAVDKSGNDNHGQAHGAKHVIEGPRDGSMSFDGQGAHISVPEIYLKEFTFSALVKVTGSDASEGFGRRILERPSSLNSYQSGEPRFFRRRGVSINNRRIFLLSNGGEKCYALQGNASSGIGIYVADNTEVNEYDWQFKSGVWVHVTVTHDGRRFKIYKNGRLTETGEIETDGVSGTLYIGGTDARRGGFWRGGIDEVAVFDRALSDEEVMGIYKMIGELPDEPEDTVSFPGAGSGEARPVKGGGSSIHDVVPSGISGDLLAYYSFSSDSGSSVTDISGMGRHGQVDGAQYSVDDVLGGCMSFSGSDSITIPNMSFSSFTYCAWMKTPLTRYSLNNREFLVIGDRVRYYSLQGNSRGCISVYITGDNEINEYDWAFSANTWTHVTITFDGSSVRIYKNGLLTEVGSANFTKSVQGTAYIGSTWEGKIDEVGVFKRALSDSEVASLFKMTGGGESETHVSYAVTGERVSRPLFALYPVIGDIRNRENSLVEIFGLGDDPILTDKDIVAYDWNTHTLKLRPGLAQQLDREYGRRSVSPFVVIANGQRCYLGAFLSHISSYMPSVPVIQVFLSGHSPEKAIRIRESPISGTKDPRSDPRIRRALEQAGLLGKSTGGSGKETEPLGRRKTDYSRSDENLPIRRGDGTISELVPSSLHNKLVLYYPFSYHLHLLSSSLDSVTDISGNGNHGRLYGARNKKDDVRGGVMSLDGEGDYITVPDIHLGDFSFSAWVKTSTRSNNRRIFTLEGDSHYFALQGNVHGGLSIVADGDEINEVNRRIENSGWVHVILSHEQGTFKLYMNGELTESGNLRSSSVKGKLYIGGTEVYGGGYWKGMIDEIAVFERAVTEVEARELFERTRHGGSG